MEKVTGEVEALQAGESRGNMFLLSPLLRKIRSYAISMHLIFDFIYVIFLFNKYRSLRRVLHCDET